jgi:two-component system alkaline phosphatase synthesis response regulator PhoP
MHVLVVEDDGKTAQWLRLYLERDGLRVSTVEDGPAALAAFDSDRPDLVLLDVMIPGLNGFDVCKAIRGEARTPIILITARAAEDDRLRGFEAGADDYITKPFSPREVVARVRAVLRRAQPDPDVDPGAPVTLGTLTLRPDALLMDAGGVSAKVTPVECRLLAVLLASPGRGWTRAQLVARVRGEDFDGNDRTIDVHIKNLRRKLESLPQAATLPRIETAHGLGYRLTCEA